MLSRFHAIAIGLHDVDGTCVDCVCSIDHIERARLGLPPIQARERYGFEVAENNVQQQEEADPLFAKQPLPLTCTIMVIGLSGVGKSATINSILGVDEASPTNAFEDGTSTIKEVSDIVAGVKMRFIDTPGLSHSAANGPRVLAQINRAYKKYKPDIVLYVDRADVIRWVLLPCTSILVQ